MAREREPAKRRFNWRPWFTTAGALVCCVSTALAAYKVRSYVHSDPQFTLSTKRRDAIVIHGLRYASRARVTGVFKLDFGRSVFAISIAERRRRLLGIDWIEEASVSRLWPDRLVVRVTERSPVAFVNLPLAIGSTRMLLIDEHGVLLEPPAQAHFSFPLLAGITELQSEAERRKHVRAMLQLTGDLGAAAKEISEVDTTELDNLRIVTQLDGRAVELMLGDDGYARRYHAFMAHYPEIRKRSPGVTAFDLRLDDRILAKDGG